MTDFLAEMADNGHCIQPAGTTADGDCVYRCRDCHRKAFRLGDGRWHGDALNWTCGKPGGVVSEDHPWGRRLRP